MDSIQNSADSELNTDKIIDQPKKLLKNLKTNTGKRKLEKHLNNKKVKNSIFDEDFNYPYEKYTKQANWRDDKDKNYTEYDWHVRAHERVKRAARPKEENKNTCSLFIETDPLIWRHIRESIADVSSFSFCLFKFIFFYYFWFFLLQHERGAKKSDIDEKTREEILSLIAHHVTAVNYIYRNTKFDGRVEHRNIRFEVSLFFVIFFDTL